MTCLNGRDEIIFYEHHELYGHLGGAKLGGVDQKHSEITLFDTLEIQGSPVDMYIYIYIYVCIYVYETK